MDIIFQTFPMKPNKPHLYIHTNPVQQKPNLAFGVEFLVNFEGKAADQCLFSHRKNLSRFIGRSNRSISDCFHQIAGPEKRESYPTRHSLKVMITAVCEGLPVSLKTEKIKFNGEHRGLGQGATSRVQVTQLLFKSVSGVYLTAVP